AVEVERYRRQAELCWVAARRRRKAGALAAELASLSAYDIALTLFLALGSGSQEGGHGLILRRNRLTRLERVHSGAFSVNKKHS
ncbi:MAG: hypothetical protein ABR590_11010, partial [Spirochaetia bacterium]